MASYLDPPLVPRNGHTLEVIMVCRVSDPRPGKQDERSLTDQEAKHREWLAQYTELPVKVTVIAGSGSGELLDREEYVRLTNEVETGRYDLVLAEDLGRIVRRVHAHLFCELCVEHDTRLVAINDRVDTACAGWEDASIFSAWHHERSNRDTSERIKRAHRSRFDGGGCAAIPIFGYRKPPGAKSDAEWEKDPEAEPIYREWFRMLDEDEAMYAEVADWLNARGVPTGPYCPQAKWNGLMVGRVTHNWLLKGCRHRNKRKTKRNSKGKYVSVKAEPCELRLRRVPHLAFFEEDYYDYVVAKVDERNGKYRRKGRNGIDPRNKAPKKRTRFPGQMIECGVCGRGYVFGGHGQTDHLMCMGAREHRCWNGVTVDGPLAAEKICAALSDTIKALPDFEEALMTTLKQERASDDAPRPGTAEPSAGTSDRQSNEVHPGGGLQPPRARRVAAVGAGPAARAVRTPAVAGGADGSGRDPAGRAGKDAGPRGPAGAAA